MKKNLVILVSDYPNSHGEPFLENELKVISKNFDKIYIIPKQYSNKLQEYGLEESTELYMPENAILKPMLYDKTVFYSKLRYLFTLRFYFELFLSKFKHKSRLTLSLVRMVLYYLESSNKIEQSLLDIIHSNKINISNTTFYSYWCDEGALALANLKKKKYITDYVTRLHGWDVYFERHEQRFLPFREVIFNYATLILPISHDARKYLLDKKMSIHPEKIITSRLGVVGLNESYRNLKDNNEIHLLTISHINKIKRLDRLIEALELITEFNVIWHHVGWGLEKDEKHFIHQINDRLLCKKNIEVVIHGEYSKTQVVHFLENTRIDVLINCSENEGIPVSIMEAFSAGIPVVAFNIGGIPEIVSDSKTGLLLKDEKGNHSQQLSEAIKAFVYMPKEEYLVYSKNAKQEWKINFDKDINYSQLSELLFKNLNLNLLSCKQCLVDSKLYPSIVIDKYGVCNVCRIVEQKNEKLALLTSSNHIDSMLDLIKLSKSGKYDCIIGISGGVDSAYLALKAREWGLNPLLVHIDNGWNSELAVFNIQTLIKELNYDLYTVVINWKELRDVVRSFFKASVIDIDWANEMCAQAALYEVCNKFGMKYILTGHQIATEGWMPDNIVHYKLDLINFKAIHKRFGERKLKTYPTIGFMKTYYYERIKKIQYVSPLDYIPYNKDEVKKELIEKFGWRDYGQKHFESIFTRFYQAYLLPKKFKVDKRRFHYSASILSGQMTKENALLILKSNEYIDSGQVFEDMEFIKKKLGFSNEEFESILKEEPKSHFEYPSLLNFRKFLTKIKYAIQNTF